MLVGVLELLSVINFSLCLKDIDFDQILLDQTLSSLQLTGRGGEETVPRSSPAEAEHRYEKLMQEFEKLRGAVENKGAGVTIF
tara:strand:+ start:557 stop:805 length:249 start_codon:yes stop_codon:yes gene_type:complete